MNTTPKEVDFLILGAGWTSTFLIPLLQSSRISYAATTTTGRNETLKFTFDPSSTDEKPYTLLPRATTVLITFPLKGKSQSELLLDMYRKTHAAMETNWIQLGSTSGFSAPGWSDHESDYDNSERGMAEERLLELKGCVLNLAGLYGGTRDPKNWVSRVARDKEGVRGKKSLHLIHGADVARAIVAVHKKFATDRWLLTDLRVYDWWELIYDWAEEVEGKWREEKRRQRREGDENVNEDKDKPRYRQWVFECMQEEGVRALPRSPESLGRALDSRAFWKSMGIWPIVGRVS